MTSELIKLVLDDAGEKMHRAVDHARKELFDGAVWYLTPGANTSGVHYDRLYRTVSDLGARPIALDAETHDRLVATVSHLPHALANVLVMLWEGATIRMQIDRSQQPLDDFFRFVFDSLLKRSS